MIGNKYLKREVELSQRHQEIITRREALLHGSEAFYDAQDTHSSSFLGGYHGALERNQLVLKDMGQFLEEIRLKQKQKEDTRFTTLKNNYWSMVTNIFPVWSDEVREFKRRKNTPRSNNSELDGLDISEADISNLSNLNTARSSTGNKSSKSGQKSHTLEKKKKRGLFGHKSKE